LVGIDASSFARFLEGIHDWDTRLVGLALRDLTATVAGVVVTELLSRPELKAGSRSIVLTVPVLRLKPDYWVRAASLRRDLLLIGANAKIPDVLIAQTCLDYRIPLITYDSGFRRFEPAGLILA
jgi:predicted nucleic acid-binding protein